MGVGSLWRHSAKEHQANVGWLWQTHLLVQSFFFFFEARLNGGIWKLGSSAAAWIVCLKGDRDLGDTALTKGQLKGSEVPASLLILEK